MLISTLAQAGPNNNLQQGDSWDLTTFFNNATNSMQTIGGAFLGLIGIVAVIAGAFFAIKKFMSEQDRRSWFTILALIIVGGAFAFTGITLVLNVARGGKDTIQDLGNGNAGTVVVAPAVAGGDGQ